MAQTTLKWQYVGGEDSGGRTPRGAFSRERGLATSLSITSLAWADSTHSLTGTSRWRWTYTQCKCIRVLLCVAGFIQCQCQQTSATENQDRAIEHRAPLSRLAPRTAFSNSGGGLGPAHTAPRAGMPGPTAISICEWGAPKSPSPSPSLRLTVLCPRAETGRQLPVSI